METPNLSETVSHIEYILDKRQLKLALDSIRPLLERCKNWDFFDRVDKIELVYRQLIDYAIKGIDDGSRTEILDRLINDTFILLDDIQDAVASAESKMFDFEQKRNRTNESVQNLLNKIESNINNRSIDNLVSDIFHTESNTEQKIAEQEDFMRHVFQAIFVSDRFTECETTLLIDLINRKQIPVVEQCLLVSALMLSLFRLFDSEKIRVLFCLLDTSQIEVRQRVIVALILVLNKYDHRIDHSKYICVKLSDIAKSDTLSREFETVFVQLLRTLETDSITQKINEEILPEMYRLSPEFQKKWKKSQENNFDIDETAVEWQDFLEENGMADKLRTFGDLQQDGSDVYMSTFASLKSFPFFYHIAHWFLPFYMQNSSVNKLFKHDNRFFEALFNNSFMCDSDKYSFCLSILQMSEHQWNATIEAFKTEAGQMVEDDLDKEIVDANFRAESVSNRYVLDLYRFYKIFPHKMSYNPMENLTEIHQKNFFLKLFSEKTRLSIADFCFARKKYGQAKEIFVHNIVDQASFYQKLGYCYQQTGQMTAAVDSYMQADELQPRNKWTMKRIAFCYKNLGKYDLALQYYRRIEQMEPDDFSVQMNIAYCLFAQQLYSDALAAYFKIDYFNPDTEKVVRAVVWCALLAGKREQAAKYAKKLTEITKSHTDLIFAGHVFFVLQQREKAIECYVEGHKRMSNSKMFFDLFDDQKAELLRFGMSNEEFIFMSEYLRFILPELKNDNK